MRYHNCKEGDFIKRISWIWKKFFQKSKCSHHYRKHWSREAGSCGGYVRRCTKCGKILD
nr:MAG TPA: Halobacterial output domain 2 [Caudoviricetes sp.]